jgi:hypothetical protein
MKKAIIIIGGLTVIGVGTYLFFKSKKITVDTKGMDTNGTSTGIPNTGTTSTSTGSTTIPPTGTILTTPEQVADTAKKIAEAKSLATQISDLRIKRNSYIAMSLNEFKKFFSNQTFWNDTSAQSFKDNQIKILLTSIKTLDEKLGKLGYMEVNGSITKIV